jgi:hypothetical protein
MKDSLRPLDGKYRQFTATYERTEVRTLNGIWFGNKVFLTDLRDKQDNDLTDHLWVSEDFQFQELSLRRGMRIRFSARVMPFYTTNKSEADFKLVGLRQISVVAGEGSAS